MEEGKTLEKAETRAAPRTLIREIILENFMSYEYARIPLKPGLNLIFGPNGAGKSSILLALSVALGQTYTERSRRLSDLIRRGEEAARVTLLFDNRPVKGRRPIPGSNSDVFRLSRHLRRDGTYWFEADYRHVPKSDVVRLLSNLGINPDNMLIIMHQGMAEEFALVSPEQRLQLVEEAVGLHPYRQKVLEAQTRLEGVLSEEASVEKLLKEAEENLAYWREQHERYQRKLQLVEKRKTLEVELAWSYVSKLEGQLESMVEEAERLKRKLDKLFGKIEDSKSRRRKIMDDLEKYKLEFNVALQRLVDAERLDASSRAKIEFAEEVLARVKLLKSIEGEKWVRKIEDEKSALERKVEALKDEIERFRAKIGEIEGRLERLRSQNLEARVAEALLEYQFREAEAELRKLYREMDRVREELEQRKNEAEKVGSRIYTSRSPQEVSEEIKVLGAHLAALADVSEEAEKTYQRFLKTYEDLKEKLAILAENKRRLLEEVELRKAVWLGKVKELLLDLNQSYGKILSSVGGRGEVRLINPQSFEKAGLELTVGFHGVPPRKLDAYTQSGGERSVTIMAFLLALQGHIASPIRAVDEFDVHCDPRNRELLWRLTVSTVREFGDVQYIVITPGQLPLTSEDVDNVIVVQKVGGKSQVKIVGEG